MYSFYDIRITVQLIKIIKYRALPYLQHVKQTCNPVHLQLTFVVIAQRLISINT